MTSVFEYQIFLLLMNYYCNSRCSPLTGLHLILNGKNLKFQKEISTHKIQIPKNKA